MPEICGLLAMIGLVLVAGGMGLFAWLDARWEQRRWEAYRRLGSRGLEILRKMDGARPEEIDGLWEEYHREDLRAAKAYLAYLVEFGERADPWNYKQNLEGAQRWVGEAELMIQIQAPAGPVGLLRRESTGSQRHGGEG